MAIIIASDTIQYSANAENWSCLNWVWQKAAQLTMEYNYIGSLRITFDLCGDPEPNIDDCPGYNCEGFGRIYKNGVPYGDEVSDFGVGIYTTYTQDFTNIDISSGDTIELWYKTAAFCVGAKNFRIRFNPAGKASFTSTPSGARIWIDGIDRGVNTPNTILPLSVGDHDYTLELEGYENATGTFSITADTTTTVPTVTWSPLASCPISIKYKGDTVYLSATPKDGTGPYYVEFRKIIGTDVDIIVQYDDQPEDVEITYDYILTNEDIRTATEGTIDFSVYIADSCPPIAQTCEQICTINIGCAAPICNFTVA